MRPILGKTKWWEKKPKENQTDNKHYKSWCVIARIKNIRHVPSKWGAEYEYEYMAVTRSNAPEYYDPERGKLRKALKVDHLTKAEAIAMAKMLNFTHAGEFYEETY